jgi:hypothetical protein
MRFAGPIGATKTTARCADCTARARGRRDKLRLRSRSGIPQGVAATSREGNLHSTVALGAPLGPVSQVFAIRGVQARDCWWSGETGRDRRRSGVEVQGEHAGARRLRLRRRDRRRSGVEVQEPPARPRRRSGACRDRRRSGVEVQEPARRVVIDRLPGSRSQKKRSGGAGGQRGAARRARRQSRSQKKRSGGAGS